jgi:O-antigen/teichoic acid export membrane protein
MAEPAADGPGDHASGPREFSLFRGAATLSAGRYVAAVFGWAGTLLVVRILSPSAWGEFVFIFSFLGIVGAIGGLQVARIAIRQIIEAGDAAGQVSSSYVCFRIVLGTVVYAVAVLIVWVAGYSTAVVVATAVAGTTLVLGGTSAGLGIVLEARLSMKPLAMSQAAYQIVQLGLTAAVALSGHGTLLLFVLPIVAGQVVMMVWRAVAVWRVARIGLRVDVPGWWVLLKESMPLSVGAALGTAYFRIDSVMLSKLDSLSAVGAYGVGYKFSDLVGSFPEAVLNPTLTLMVRHWPHHRPDFHHSFHRAFVLLTVVGVGIGVEFGAFAGNAIGLFYGQRYATVAGAAVLLMVGQLLAFFTNLSFYTLAAVKRHRAYPLASLLGVLVNVGLNLVLIPRYSYTGSGIATVITEVIVLGILVVPVSRVPAVRPIPWIPLGKSLVAGAAMAAVVLGLRVVLPWPVAAILGGIAYLAALHAIRIDGRGGLRSLAGSRPVLSEASSA